MRIEFAHLLRETGTDLACVDPLTLGSRPAAGTQNERAHLLLGSLAQDEPADDELLPMDSLAL
jgi:hypothetical protein